MDNILKLASGKSIRVDCPADGIWRVRAGENAQFPTGGLERYGILPVLPSESVSTSKFVTEEL